MQDLFTVLVPHWKNVSQSYYGIFRSSLREIYQGILSELPIIYYVNTDTDITISDEKFFPIYDHRYQIFFNATQKELINTTIRNNTIKNLHLNMINTESSVIVDGNIFIGSGIKVVNKVKEDSALLIITNNTFQGISIRPVVELSNMKNVTLNANYFENLQILKSFIYEGIPSIGIVCNNWRFNLYDSLFKNMTLSTIIHLDYSLVKMDNLNFLKNNLYSAAIRMIKTNGSFSNIIFADNSGRACFDVSNVELLLSNVTFSGNSFRVLTIVWISHIVLINVTAEKNTGQLMSVAESSAVISSCRWQENSGNGMFYFNRGSSAAMTTCNFIRNTGMLILCSTDKELVVSSCRFEENMHNEDSLIETHGTITKFQDTYFLNNLVNKTEKGIIYLDSSRASFDNCTGMNNYVGYSFGFLMLSYSSMTISNCKFSGYRFGDLERSTILTENTVFERGGPIRAFMSSTIVASNSTFIENRSFGSDGGAIFLTDKSEMTSEIVYLVAILLK